MQSSATGAASKAAAGDQRLLYRINEAKMQPWASAGEIALHQAEDFTRGGWQGYQDQMRAGFQTDPGYEFQLSQGLRGANAAQNAAHMLDSGATHKADIGYAEGLANQQFGQYAGRFDDYVNKLLQLSSVGQSAALQTANMGQQVGTNLGNIAMRQGAAQSAIYGDATKGLGTAVNQLFGNPQFQDMLGIGGSSIYNTSANRLAGMAPSYGSTPTGFGLFGSAGPGVGSDFALPPVY